MPQISVIVPACRPPDFDALGASMAANADADAEWIVVDDGSGRDYDAVFAALPDGVHLIRQVENRRQGAARNTGLAQAQGRWVKFLDADDQLDAGHLAALYRAAETLSADAIPFAPTRHIFANGTASVNDSWRDLPLNPSAQLRRQLVRPFLHHCGALFPRDLLERLGGYDETLVTDEDGDLLLRILEAGCHFVPVPKVNYLYIHHNQGSRVSADDNIAKMQARVRACDLFEARQGAALPPNLADALAQRMDKIAMTYWQAFPNEAQTLLIRARQLCPGYVPDLRAPLWLARWLGGPGMVPVAQGLYRRLKGRPNGGAQGHHGILKLRKGNRRMYRTLASVRGGYRILNYVNKLRITFGQPIQVVTLNDGTQIKLDLRSRTEWPAYYSKSYDDEILCFILSALKTFGGSFFDIGANIGFYSIRLARSMPVDQQIYAFEPISSNYQRLKENAAINGLQNLEIFKLALSNQSGPFKIIMREDFKDGASTGNASLAISENADSGFESEVIECMKLDDFMRGREIEPIGVVKIDIEGHEDLCFLGAGDTFERDRPVIFSEVNNWYFEKRGVNSGEAFLKSLPVKYDVFKMQEKGQLSLEKISFSQISMMRGMHNVVFCPEEKQSDLLSTLKY